MKSSLHLMVIFVLIFSQFISANVSPSSIENVCPGEKISLVCSVNGQSLTWLVPDPTGVKPSLDRGISSVLNHMVGERLSIPGDTLGAYTATLDSVTPTLNSTLEVTLYRSMDGRDIVCSGVTVPIDIYGELYPVVFVINYDYSDAHACVLSTDPPAPTSNIHITSTMNNTEESIVSLEWDYVSDGAPVNYSVTVNGGPESDTVSAVTVEMEVELTLRYNTEYAVLVEVINCAGSSSSSMFTLELGIK